MAAAVGLWMAFGMAGGASAQSIVFPAQPVDLGSVAAGTPLNGSFDVDNGGGGAGNPDLVISAIDLAPTGGDNCTVFTVTAGLPISVSKNMPKPVTVDFSAAMAGTYTCTLSFVSNDTTDPEDDTVQVQATALLVPDITVAPLALPFGDQLVGTPSAAQMVTITNDGSAGLEVTSATLAGTDPGDFTATPSQTLPHTLAPTESLTVSVTFDPTALGARSATLDIASDDPDENPTSVALTGTGVEPDITVTPLMLPFGDQPVGTFSAAQVITVRNDGTADLEVTSVTLAGTVPGDFTATPSQPLPHSLAPAGSLTISVVFNPGATGARSATLDIANDDPDPGENPTTVALSGTGTQPDITVAPLMLTYTDQLVGTPSAAQTVTVTNDGNADLQVTAVSLNGMHPGDFTATPSQTLPHTLAPTESLTLSVVFDPNATGARSALLDISNTDPDPGESTTTVTLTGTGVAPDITVAPLMLTYTDQLVGTPSAAQVITVTNDGTADLEVTSLALNGMHPGDFTATPSQALPFTLAPTENLTVSVVFNPTAAGARSATLDIASDDPDPGENPTTVALTGTGIEPDITVTPLMLTYADRRVGTPSTAQIVTVRNDGAAPLEVTSLALNGTNPTDFAATPSQTLPFTLSPAGSLTVSVVFTPTAAGVRSASLDIASDDPDENPTTVALTGTGLAPDITVAPPTLSFLAQPVGVESAAQTVTITNDGDFDLIINSVVLGGTNPGSFSVTAPALTTIPPAGMTTVDVTCTPSGPGMLTASLDISSDDPNEPLVSVALDCTGMDPPIMTLVPDMLDFGDVFVNASSDLTFEVFNEMGVFRFPLNVTDIQVVSGDVGDFAVDITSFQVDAGNSQVVTVTFTPTAMGVRSAIIQVTSDDAINPVQTVMVTGVGRQRLIDVAPPAIDFGLVATGDTSPARTITVTNTGNALLTISDVALGTGAEFALMGNTSTTIQGGMSETWMLTCTPPAAQAYTDTLTFTSDADNSATVVVDLDCGGTDDPLLTNPTPIAFPDTYVGDAATPIDVDINNVTALPITVNGITITDNVYTLTVNQTVPFTLAALGTETITIDFTPLANQPYPALLQVDTAEHGTIEFPVDGRGVEAVMQITDPDGGFDPISYDYGSLKVFTSSGAQTFTITNVGTTAFTVAGMSISNVDDFTLVPPVGMTTLQPNGSVDFTIEAHPRMVGARSGTVTIQTDIRGSMTAMFDVLVDGTSGDIELSDTSLDFGAVDVQGALPVTRTLTITNPTATASDVLEIMDVQLAPSTVYRLATGQATSASLAIGETFDITVEYTPTVESAGDNATLTISADAATAMTSQIPISGRGIDRHIQLSAMNVSFPDTVRNPETPAQETVTISNTGDAPLAISMVVTGGPDAAAFSIGSSFMEVAPQGSEDLLIEFAPDAANPNYSGTVTIVNDDDERPMAVITLGGAGVVPNVMLVAPPNLTMRTGEGVPIRLSEIVDVGVLQLANMDSASFRVANVRVVDMGGAESSVFQVVGFQPDTQLPGGASLAIDVELLSDTAGTYTGIVEVYLGGDPERIAFLTLTGEVVPIDVRGGCDVGAPSAGGPGGPERTGALLLVLLALGLVALRRSRRSRTASARARNPVVARFFPLAVLALVMFDASTARAQNAYNIDLTTFRPAPSAESSMLSVENAEVAPNGAWSLALSVDHAVDPMTVRTVMGAMDVVDRPVAGRTAAALLFSYAFLDRFEAGLVMPFFQQSGEDPTITGVMPANGTALGDLAVHARAAILQTGALSLAGSAMVTVPTASDGMFAGIEGPSVHVRAIGGYSLGRLRFAANAGFVGRGTNKLGDLEQGNALSYGLAARYRVSNRISAVAELFGLLGLSGEEPAAASPAEAAFGFRYRMNQSVSLNLGAGVGLPSGAGSPRVRGIFMFSYAFGASEYKPLPKPKKRRKPTPLDQDADGVADKVDKCPDEAEDEDLFEDDDGCPEWDNDEDGVDDSLDKCPLRAEDKDGFEDEDGCPELDNDGDKIVDADDKCPNVAEDMDGFSDLDGCDDPDNDGDGVPDVIDMCVLEPETINGVKDEDGCPDEGDGLVMLMADRLELFEPIQFRGDSARLTPRSENLLGQVAATLRSQPDILKVRVGVHVHPKNNKDQARSKERAEAVRDWLVKWGILPERLEIKAYGSSQPLVPKKQRGAKAINERVEFVILEKAIQ